MAAVPRYTNSLFTHILLQRTVYRSHAKCHETGHSVGQDIQSDLGNTHSYGILPLLVQASPQIILYQSIYPMHQLLYIISCYSSSSSDAEDSGPRTIPPKSFSMTLESIALLPFSKSRVVRLTAPCRLRIMP